MWSNCENERYHFHNFSLGQIPLVHIADVTRVYFSKIIRFAFKIKLLVYYPGLFLRPLYRDNSNYESHICRNGPISTTGGPVSVILGPGSIVMQILYIFIANCGHCGDLEWLLFTSVIRVPVHIMY